MEEKRYTLDTFIRTEVSETHDFYTQFRKGYNDLLNDILNALVFKSKENLIEMTISYNSVLGVSETISGYISARDIKELLSGEKYNISILYSNNRMRVIYAPYLIDFDFDYERYELFGHPKKFEILLDLKDDRYALYDTEFEDTLRECHKILKEPAPDVDISIALLKEERVLVI